MEFNKNKNGSTLIVRIIGKLNTNTSPELLESLNDDLNEDISELILDFDKLEYISSAGLRILALFQDKMNNKKGIMKIINLQPSVKKILEVSGFLELLIIE